MGEVEDEGKLRMRGGGGRREGENERSGWEGGIMRLKGSGGRGEV